MNEFTKKLLKILDVKSLISLIAAIVFGTLAINGTLGIENTMILLTMVFQSFFSYQTNKKGNDKE